MSEKEKTPQTGLFVVHLIFDEFCGRKDARITWCKSIQNQSLPEYFSEEEADKLSQFLIRLIPNKTVQVEEVEYGWFIGYPSYRFDIELLQTEDHKLPFAAKGAFVLKNYDLTERSKKKVDEMALFMLKKSSSNLGLSEAGLTEALGKQFGIISDLYQAFKVRATKMLDYAEAEKENNGFMRIHIDRPIL